MNSTDGLAMYQNLVDGLVGRREGVLPTWIREKGWPQVPENEEVNEFLSKLTPSEKEIITKIAREARDGGIHDTLAYMQELMDLKDLRLAMNNVELPVSPYDTGMNWDWVARAGGAEWPALPSHE